MTSIAIVGMILTFLEIMLRYRDDDISVARAIIYFFLAIVVWGVLLPILMVQIGFDADSDLGRFIDILVMVLIAIGGLITVIVGFIRRFKANKAPSEGLKRKRQKESKNVLEWGAGITGVAIAMILKILGYVD